MVEYIFVSSIDTKSDFIEETELIYFARLAFPAFTFSLVDAPSASWASFGFNTALYVFLSKNTGSAMAGKTDHAFRPAAIITALATVRADAPPTIWTGAMVTLLFLRVGLKETTGTARRTATRATMREMTNAIVVISLISSGKVLVR